MSVNHYEPTNAKVRNDRVSGGTPPGDRIMRGEPNLLVEKVQTV